MGMIKKERDLIYEQVMDSIVDDILEVSKIDIESYGLNRQQKASIRTFIKQKQIKKIREGYLK